MVRCQASSAAPLLAGFYSAGQFNEIHILTEKNLP